MIARTHSLRSFASGERRISKGFCKPCLHTPATTRWGHAVVLFLSVGGAERQIMELKRWGVFAFFAREAGEKRRSTGRNLSANWSAHSALNHTYISFNGDNLKVPMCPLIQKYYKEKYLEIKMLEYIDMTGRTLVLKCIYEKCHNMDKTCIQRKCEKYSDM